MTELNVFEDAASGLIILEAEGRLVKATPQQAMSLMVSLSRRFGYQVVPTQQEQQVEKTEQTEQPAQPVEVEQEEDEIEEESDEEVEELFEEAPQPASQRVAVKKTLPPPPPPPPARPLNVAKQVEAKMMQQRSPGKVGKSF